MITKIKNGSSARPSKAKRKASSYRVNILLETISYCGKLGDKALDTHPLSAKARQYRKLERYRTMSHFGTYKDGKVLSTLLTAINEARQVLLS